MPRTRSSKGNIAKSLPMDIPTFLSKARNTSTEDLDDIVSYPFVYFFDLKYSTNSVGYWNICRY